MLPAEVEIFKTDGEKRFYRFMESAAKPDSQYVCWYTPDIEDREPDFVGFSNRSSLLLPKEKTGLDPVEPA